MMRLPELVEVLQERHAAAVRRVVNVCSTSSSAPKVAAEIHGIGHEVKELSGASRRSGPLLTAGYRFGGRR
jgi:hypothetical protein